MKRANASSARVWCLVFALSLHCECLWAQRPQGPAQPNVVAKYIQAIQRRDFKTIIDLRERSQAVVANIKSNNPQVLWSKLVGEYYQEETSSLSEQRDFGRTFPASCKWAISETRRQRTQQTVYVTVDYPSWQDAPLIEFGRPAYKLLKSTIVEFTVDSDSQLISGWERVAAADVYREEPLRIVNTKFGWLFDGVSISLSAVGGVPPFTCGIQFGSLRRQEDCYRPDSSDFYFEFKWEATREFSLSSSQVRIRIADSRGRADGISLTAPEYPGGLPPVYSYCWVRDPWLQRGTGRPKGPSLCKEPIQDLTETRADLVIAPMDSPSIFAILKEKFSGKLREPGCEETLISFVSALRKMGRASATDLGSTLRDALSNVISADIRLSGGENTAGRDNAKCINEYLLTLSAFEGPAWETFPYWYTGEIHAPGGTWGGGGSVFWKILEPLNLGSRATDVLDEKSSTATAALQHLRQLPPCNSTYGRCRTIFVADYIRALSPSRVELFGKIQEYDELFSNQQMVGGFKADLQRSNDQAKPWLIEEITRLQRANE